MATMDAAGAGEISVREMLLSEVELRIRYFHEASDDYLIGLGVDRALLPSPEAWMAFHEQDYQCPLPERENYLLLWELENRPVGFSTLDHIVFGHEAFMHLHMVEPAQRRQGLGTEFVRRSATVYFKVFELARLYSEPKALNVGPNRTLQRAGFSYVQSYDRAPGPLNFRQITNLWVLEPSPLGGRGSSDAGVVTVEAAKPLGHRDAAAGKGPQAAVGDGTGL